jgi:hypothetical protein
VDGWFGLSIRPGPVARRQLACLLIAGSYFGLFFVVFDFSHAAYPHDEEYFGAVMSYAETGKDS